MPPSSGCKLEATGYFYRLATRRLIRWHIIPEDSNIPLIICEECVIADLTGLLSFKGDINN